MKSYHTNGFTLIELIFVIVIIGVLTAVAIPQFKNLTDNAKISSELATASSVQSAIDAIHGDWITSGTCSFDWGNEQNTTANPLNDKGYPATLGNQAPFDYILKNANNGDWVKGLDGYYRGPASLKGDSNHKVTNKPNKGEWWEYNASAGTFSLHDIP